jgi:hypothetical protein
LPPPRSRVFSGLAYGVYAVTAAWLLLELAGVLGLVSYKDWLAGPSKFSMGFTLAPDRDERGETYQDTAYTWGLDTDPIPFHFRTDGHGLRNAEDRSEADVYLLGDSIVVGALVPFEETVTAKLEGALALDVMNVALLSIGPQQQHHVFRELGLPVDGRVVVQFIFEGNDQKDSHNYRVKQDGRPGEKKARGTAEKLWRRSLVRNLLDLLALEQRNFREMAEKRTCRIDGQLHTFHYGRLQVRDFDDEIDHITADLEAFSEEVSAQGGRYLVAFVPTKLRVLEDLCEFPDESDLPSEHFGPLREALVGEWSQRSGIPVLDLTPALQAAARSGRIPWFWGDTHWNEEGHQVASRALASWPALRGAVGGD